jgi:hypothetical protein
MEVGGMFNAAKLVVVALATAGCATSGTGPSSRTFVRGDAVKVVVEGGGVVRGGPIECSSESAFDPRSTNSQCTAALNELWATELVAHPEPGWSFAGWRRSIQHSKLSQTPGFEREMLVETAVFTRSDELAQATPQDM